MDLENITFVVKNATTCFYTYVDLLIGIGTSPLQSTYQILLKKQRTEHWYGSLARKQLLCR